MHPLPPLQGVARVGGKTLPPMRLPQIFLVLLLVAAVAQAAYYYPHVEKQIIAAHFTGSAAAAGVQLTRLFFAVYALVLAFGLGLWLGFPALLKRHPEQLINIPHRAYWLEPERRAQTIVRFTDHFDWLGVATIALILLAMQIVLLTNLSPTPHFSALGLWLPFGVYLVFMALWLARLNALFKRSE